MPSIKPCYREEARGKKYLDVYQSYFRILQRSKSAAFSRMKFPRANRNVCSDSKPISSHVIVAPELADSVYYLSFSYEQVMLLLNTVWSNTANSNIKNLQGVQNFACRIITRTRNFDHITPALQELNLVPIKQYLPYRDSIMTFKFIIGLAPSHLSDQFCKRNTIHNRNTRNCGSLQIPLCKTKSGQRSFRYRAVSIWNYLHSDLKQLTSLSQFKGDLKSGFITKLYSLVLYMTL